jgi:glucose-1-phosphate adenylyltransferase
MTDKDIQSLITQRSVALIMGGGRGTRLFPLTKARSKPAVSVGGKYRLIDIPISNCINSGISMIYVLTQFLSAGLNRHITRTYRFDSFGRRFVEILASEQTPTNFEYAQGTADAVRRSLRYLENLDTDYVFILSGDQLCRINLYDMLSYHLQKNADVTLSCIRITEDDVKKSGVVRVDGNFRVIDFAEKPVDPDVVRKYRISDHAQKEKNFLGSMGVYLFNKKVLQEVLKNIEEHDFGKGVFPRAIRSHTISAYIFDGYWEDIGTIKTYFDASMQLCEENPPFSFYDLEMPIYTHHRNLPPPKLFNSTIDTTLIAEGSVIRNSRVKKSIIGIRTYVRSGCDIEEAVIVGNDLYPAGYNRMNADEKDHTNFGIKNGTKIRRAIIDKNVVIGKNCVITGCADDSVNYTTEDDSPFYIINGIVVIPRCVILPDNTVIDATRYATAKVR